MHLSRFVTSGVVTISLALSVSSTGRTGTPPTGPIVRALGAVGSQLAYLPDGEGAPPQLDRPPAAPDLRYAFCIDLQKDAFDASEPTAGDRESPPPSIATVAKVLRVNTPSSPLHLPADAFPKKPFRPDPSVSDDRLHTAYQMAVWAASDDISSDRTRGILQHRFGGASFSQGQQEEIVAKVGEILEKAGLERGAYDSGSAKSQYNQGWKHYEAGSLEFAEADFRRATEIDPTYADAHFNLGNVLTMQHKTEAAAQSFLAYVRLRREDPDGWANLEKVASAEVVKLARLESARAAGTVALASPPPR